MQTTIRMGRLRYRVMAPTDIKPILAKLYKEEPNRTWADVAQYVTPEAMLAERVKDLKAYALKRNGKHRKIRLYPSPRIFPPNGLSTKAYVTAYYSLNGLGTPSHTTRSRTQGAGEQPDLPVNLPVTQCNYLSDQACCC